MPRIRIKEKTILVFHSSTRASWQATIQGIGRFARTQKWRLQVIEYMPDRKALADTATSAGKATNADHAFAADSATRANSAGWADNAGNANYSNTAGVANSVAIGNVSGAWIGATTVSGSTGASGRITGIQVYASRDGFGRLTGISVGVSNCNSNCSNCSNCSQDCGDSDTDGS